MQQCRVYDRMCMCNGSTNTTSHKGRSEFYIIHPPIKEYSIVMKKRDEKTRIYKCITPKKNRLLTHHGMMVFLSGSLMFQIIAYSTGARHTRPQSQQDINNSKLVVVWN